MILPEILKSISNPKGLINFSFNPDGQEWKKFEGKTLKTVSGICAGSDVPIKKNGKTFYLKDEDLPKIAKINEGIPFTWA